MVRGNAHKPCKNTQWLVELLSFDMIIIHDMILQLDESLECEGLEVMLDHLSS